jgi:pyridoxamine 5'-phosphate oxidase
MEPLEVEGAGGDPVLLFDRWFEAARGAGLPEPEAVTLATASADGVPSARMVLLRGWGADGFDWYTNRRSRKGAELEANPRAALVAYWQPMARQVRIEGTVRPMSREASAAYFAVRPRGHQIGAWASAQSTEIPDRAHLERRVAEETLRWEGREVELPPYWGGYRLVPSAIEFWQGRPDRLHDRVAYTRPPGGGDWTVRRLSP